MGFAAFLMTTSCVYMLAVPVPLESTMTHSTCLDRPEMMSDSPCVRGHCSTPEMGEIRLTSNPKPKGPLFSETGQYISFATI